jgi:hypothetical protein
MRHNRLHLRPPESRAGENVSSMATSLSLLAILHFVKPGSTLKALPTITTNDRQLPRPSESGPGCRRF